MDARRPLERRASFNAVTTSMARATPCSQHDVGIGEGDEGTSRAILEAIRKMPDLEAEPGRKYCCGTSPVSA